MLLIKATTRVALLVLPVPSLEKALQTDGQSTPDFAVESGQEVLPLPPWGPDSSQGGPRVCLCLLCLRTAPGPSGDSVGRSA